MIKHIEDLVENQINMVPLDLYINWLDESSDVGGDKENLLIDIFYNKVDGDRMGALIESVMEYGMTGPIELMRVEDPFDDTVRFTQGNGHHRLIVAMLLMLDVIPVYYHQVSSMWDIDFHSTSMTNGNKFFVNYSVASQTPPVTNAGRDACWHWRPLLEDIREELDDVFWS